MLIESLFSSESFTKTVILESDGTLTKTPYPNVFRVTSQRESVADLADFCALLTKRASLGHCILKGLLARPLTDESRAGATDSSASTEWLCLDIDGLPTTFTPAATADTPYPSAMKITPDVVMQMLGIPDTSYVLQWSASQGLPGPNINSLRCHLFVRLAKPIPAPLIKQWLIQLNHTVPLLSDNLKLTKTGHALHWALDVTTCQNDKLIYIAPPTLKNLKNPLGRTPRISLVKHKSETFQFPGLVNSTQVNRELTIKRIGELREAAGLPARKLSTKVVHGQEVLTNPDVCTVTGLRTERGFTYLNLNDGDSWGYYHPEDRQDIIYNFKGEPNYLTKDLVPHYWAAITASASRTTQDGLTYLAFLDRETSAYYRGTYDASTDELDITMAKNETQVRHFAEQYGVPLGSFIPEWTVNFDPHEPVRVNTDTRTINTFQLTHYMRVPPKVVAKCPPTIFRIIHHVLGNDADCTAHFLNWVAFILQKRTRTLTAWVLHGTEGTGKGILMNRILRPIFGVNQTASRRMEDFDERYNNYMKQCFIVFVDEVEAKAFSNEKSVMAKMRSFITEPKVTIRQMHASAVECPNFTNWILSSNRPEPVIIPPGDRRFNVGGYQPKKLGMTDAELDRIPDELQAFHDFLLSYPLDTQAAATPLDTADRTTMMAVSQTSIDGVVDAILNGSMEFLIDQLPSTTAYTGTAIRANKLEDYKHALRAVMLRTNGKTGSCSISRDELQVIFEYVVGNMPESPNKFTTMLRHHRVHTEKVWVDGRPAYGVRTTFKDIAQFPQYVKLHFTPPTPAAVATKAINKAKARP